MIPKSRKFPMRTEFLTFRRRAQHLSTSHFTCYYHTSSQTKGKTRSRLAVVVPKKVNQLATTRNWLKRLSFDTIWPLIINTDLDVVVVYKPLKLNQSIAVKQQLVSDFTALEFK